MPSRQQLAAGACLDPGGLEDASGPLDYLPPAAGAPGSLRLAAIGVGLDLDEVRETATSVTLVGDWRT